MKFVEFTVNDSKLSKASNSPKTIESDASQFRVKFSGEFWKDCKSIAAFDLHGIDYASPIDKDGTCIIPEEARDNKISFYRFKIVGVKNETRKRIDTNTLLIIKEV